MAIETLDFNNSADGMVDLPRNDKVSRDNTYETQREISDRNNNIDDNQTEEDMDLATPLSEVMGDPEPPMMQQPMMMQAPSANAMMAPQAPPQAAPQQAKGQVNPGNLTDEQLDAVLVAAAAMLAFSNPVREKMLQYTPQLFNEAGARTLAGGIATGVVAGSVFYGVKKFVLNK